MAVSYLSQPIESNPYVVPVDLGLLQKVNQYKQSQFYQNTDRINTQFAQLNALDIANPYQKQHAQDVIQNLSTQIQNMGGLDYSDPNVSNTISGYASDVYNDKAVLNGIMSTKGIRSYQNNSEKVKTDPKLSKYYDPAREWYDTQYEENPNSMVHYLKGDISSTYNGPTAPTPSLGSDWDVLTKEIQRINPDIDTRFDPSGNRFFIEKSTGSVVSASRIRQMVDGKIDGRVADQLNVHAAYNYYGLTNGTYSKEQGISEFNSHNRNNLERINQTITSIQNQITIEPDNDTRLRLEKQLQDLTDELAPAQKAVTQGAKDFSNLWDKSKSAAFYNLYTNKLKDDISSVYAYKQTKSDLIVNQEALANARMDLEAMKEGFRLQRNADGTLKKVKIVPDPLLGQLQPDNSTSADLAKKEITQQTVQADVDKIQHEINSDLYNVIFESAKVANVPGLFDDSTTTINNDITANPISHGNLLKKVAQLAGNDSQLEREDIDRVLQNVSKAGSFDSSGNFTFNKGNKQEYYNNKTNKPIVALTAAQITFFKKVQGIMDDGANGQDISGRISNAAAWRGYLNKYSIQQNAVKNKQALVKTAQDQVLDQFVQENKLSPQQTQQLKEFYNKSKEQGNKETPFFVPDMWGNIFGVFDAQKILPQSFSKTFADQIDKRVNDLLNTTANRKNYYSVLLPDETKDLEDQFPQIKNYMNNSEVVLDTDIVKKKEQVNPISVVTDGEQYFIKYNNKEALDKGFGYTPITEENLNRFGVATVPYPALEEVVSQHGRLYQPIYIDPMATKNSFNKANNFTAPIKIDIVNMNASGNRNSDNYTPTILYKGKEYYYRPGNSSSANAALQLLTSALQNNQSFKNLDEFIAALDRYNQQ